LAIPLILGRALCNRHSSGRTSRCSGVSGLSSGRGSRGELGTVHALRSYFDCCKSCTSNDGFVEALLLGRPRTPAAAATPKDVERLLGDHLELGRNTVGRAGR
jgi:hypothetical protein